MSLFSSFSHEPNTTTLRIIGLYVHTQHPFFALPLLHYGTTTFSGEKKMHYQTIAIVGEVSVWERRVLYVVIPLYFQSHSLLKYFSPSPREREKNPHKKMRLQCNATNVESIILIVSRVLIVWSEFSLVDFTHREKVSSWQSPIFFFVGQ